MKQFAVIGLGRFGQKLSIALAMSGAEVIAIDKNREQIELIRDQVSHAVRLDSTDDEALKAQGVDKIDVAIVSIGQGTGRGFESAILTVVNLRQMGVGQIYARAEDLIAGEVFSKVGATDVIYPEIESAQRWAYKLIAPQIGEKIDFAPGYSLARIKAPASFDNKTVLGIGTFIICPLSLFLPLSCSPRLIATRFTLYFCRSCKSITVLLSKLAGAFILARL